MNYIELGDFATQYQDALDRKLDINQLADLLNMLPRELELKRDYYQTRTKVPFPKLQGETQ